MEQTESRPSKPKLPPVRVVRTVNRIRSGVAKLNRNLVPPQVSVLEMITGMWTAQAVSVAAKLGVADRMNGNTAYSSDALAAQVEAHPESLYRLMRALAAEGIFVEEDGKRFRLTARGKCLREDHPQSVRYLAIFEGQVNWSNWNALEHCVKTGTNAVEHVHGKKPFEFLFGNPEAGEIFNRAMTNMSSMEIQAVLAVYDFSPFKVIADVGGGHGAVLGAILKLNPQARGILFDMDSVIEGARKTFKQMKLDSRTELQTGSFFERVPQGADLYLMKHIIHDWSDAESTRILKAIRSNISSGGKLVLIETVIPGPKQAHFSKWLDLEMLVVTTGKERTEEQYRKLFAGAGFRLERIVPTISMASVIEASPV
jgi:hypothetical protein